MDKLQKMEVERGGEGREVEGYREKKMEVPRRQ